MFNHIKVPRRVYATCGLLIVAALASVTLSDRLGVRGKPDVNQNHTSIRLDLNDSIRTIATLGVTSGFTENSTKSKRLPALDKRTIHLRNTSENNLITVVYAACGSRLHEAGVSIKSLLSFYGEKHLQIIVFAEPGHLELTLGFLKSIIFTQAFSRTQVNLIVLEARFPGVENPKEWHDMYAHCATLRIFLPELLLDKDAVLWVDSDTIFTRSVGDLWQRFHNMLPIQIVAAAAEQVHITQSWYRNSGKVLFVPPFGINDGVMLMNLTRMRTFQWISKLKGAYEKYKADIQLADQDMINIVLHFNPDNYTVLPCIWNFRWGGHCYDTLNLCKSALRDPIGLFHGNSQAFLEPISSKNRLPSLWKIVEQFDPDKMALTQLYEELRSLFLLNSSEVCGDAYQNLALNLPKQLSRL